MKYTHTNDRDLGTRPEPESFSSCESDVVEISAERRDEVSRIMVETGGSVILPCCCTC